MAVPDLIFSAGGNPAFRAVATACGWLNGAKLPTNIYGRLDFADQDWHKPDRAAYMRALARHRHGTATVLDWEREEQWPEVLSWAEEAAQYVRRLVLIPKVPGLLAWIPERIGGVPVILGYSVPTTYGATPVPLWEFAARPVHLLGGSPQRQMDLARYLNVASADGNMAHQQAHRCRFWSRRPGAKGHWIQLADTGDGRQKGANLEAFRRSCLEIREAWGFTPSAR